MKLSDNTLKPGARILFASVPLDGHFNPLTSLAVYLKNKGYDVRWYNSPVYRAKVESCNIPFYPFKKALDIRSGDIDTVFPERVAHKGTLAKLKFDIKHCFILRATEYYEDIQEIYRDFPFDVMIADNAFTAIPFVKEKMNIPVMAIGVLPLTASSKDLPPSGLGMTPSYSFAGKIKQRVLRWAVDNFIFKESKQLVDSLFEEYGIAIEKGNVFDTLIRKSDLVLQSGAPGFDYKRSDMNSNVRYIGALLPHSSKNNRDYYQLKSLKQGQKVILVTQGTVEKDIEKLLVPTLEAFKHNSNYLVVATTGGSNTAELRARYPQEHIVIEDFIPFNDIMPLTDVYISNGGYGGVMLGINHGLPMVVAGIHEGKNEICARTGYFDIGVNLRTEKPTARQIAKAVEHIMDIPLYKMNAIMLREEFSRYNPQELCEQYLKELLLRKPVRVSESSLKIAFA